jgi:citrate synthase
MHTMVHDDLRRFFDGFPRDAHPMPVLSSAVSALSTFYQDSLDPFDDRQVEISTIRLMAKIPTLAAYAYKKTIGQPSRYPDNSLDYVSNFMNMTFGVPAEPYEVNPAIVKALDMLFILHADHEQNCSTSTVRMVGSSHANLFASVSAGINALFGPLHGGANQAVLEMLEGIQSSGDTVQQFIQRVKNREDGVKLMGFGHRVYKSYDPRAATHGARGAYWNQRRWGSRGVVGTQSSRRNGARGGRASTGLARGPTQAARALTSTVTQAP